MLDITVKTGAGWVLKLDPRLKILLVIIYSVLMAISYRFEAVIAGFVLTIGIAGLSGIPIKEILKRLIPVNLFMIFLWIFLPFTYSGTMLYKFWVLTATYEGVHYAALITIKSNALMLMLVILTLSTSLFTLGNALQVMGVPGKLIYLLFFTYRYIHVIYQEYLRILNAMKIRGFIPKTNWHTYRSYAYMVGMLLVKSAERARRVYQAMQCRGFSGEFHSLNEYKLNTNDIVSAAFMSAILMLIGVLEWTTLIAL